MQDAWQLHHPSFSETRANPVSGSDLYEALQELAQEYDLDPQTWTLAITGGEPLVQYKFLQSWLPQWQGPVLLETAGIWSERLACLLPHLDSVSLDWKLNSALEQGQGLQEPATCAQLCRQAGVDFWVKIVVDGATSEVELSAALESLSHAVPGATVFLQPATVLAEETPVAEGFLLAAMLRHKGTPLDLRVRPQIHPLLGVL